MVRAIFVLLSVMIAGYSQMISPVGDYKIFALGVGEMNNTMVQWQPSTGGQIQTLALCGN